MPEAVETAENPNEIIITTQVSISAPLEQVVQLLSNMKDFAKFNPLVQKVEILSKPDSQVTEAVITDQIPLGPIQIPIQYNATSTLIAMSEEKAHIQNTADAPFPYPGLKLHLINNVYLSLHEGLVELIEEANVHFPAKPKLVPQYVWNKLSNFVLTQTKTSHKQMYQRLKDYLGK